MAWIEFHGAQIKRKSKFQSLRKDLRLPTLQALGFLASLWSEIIELADDGDITDWSPEYLCEVSGTNLDPKKVWTALVTTGWLDVTTAGQVLVHDWIDYAGIYLRRKYSRNREKLVEIWAKHGRTYGQENADLQQTSSRPHQPTNQPTKNTLRVAQENAHASNIMGPVENSDHPNPECLKPEYLKQIKALLKTDLSVKKHLLGMGHPEHAVDEAMGKKH